MTADDFRHQSHRKERMGPRWGSSACPETEELVIKRKKLIKGEKHYFILPEIYPNIANNCSFREILEFQNTHLVYSFRG